MAARIAVKQNNRRMEDNGQALQQQVRRAGFTGLSSKIEEGMKQGQQQFSVPVFRYVNEKERLDYQLFFIKDHFGQYRFDGYKANPYNQSKPGEKRQQYFGMEKGGRVNMAEAYNLLSGRFIKREDKWMQL